MHLRISRINQESAGMAAAALGAGGGHDAAVVGVNRMNRIKWVGMAGSAVSANSKGFARSQAYQAALCIMAD